MAGGEVRLVRLVKRFEDVAAVDGIDLEVRGGELFSLLGPSGCGKTTTLRLVAGFEEPTAGAILLDGVDMARTPPHKRRVNTLPGMVERLIYQGSTTQLVVRLAYGEALQALVQNQGSPLPWRQGTAVAAHLPADALRVLPDASAGAGA